MTKTEKLPFVVAYAADMHGCGWHRIITPAQAIVKAGLAYARMTHAIIPIDEMVASKPDVVVFQRQVEEGQIQHMKDLRAALPNAKFIYELDDHLSAVDEDNYHEVFLAPPDEIDARIAAALDVCDGAVCPTESLAIWLRSLSSTPVTVLPNLLPELDGPLPEITVKPKEAKVRIGWAGGISHDGDLEQLIPAVRAIATGPLKDRVQFVFMGMRPKGLDQGLYEFKEGVPPHEFGRALASLNLDVALAPIQQSLFNEGKSSLRLVQAGMIGAATIASPVGEYVKCTAVMAYAENPAEWQIVLENAIREDRNTLTAYKRAQRTWAMGYAMSANAGWVAQAWGLEYQEKPKAKLGKKYVVHGLDLAVHSLGDSFVQGPADITEAYAQARSAGAGLVLARGMTDITPGNLRRLVAATEAAGMGSASAFSNDGATGAGIMNAGQFLPLTPDQGEDIEVALGLLEKKLFPLPFPIGPVSVLSPRAVQTVVAYPEGGAIATLAEWGAVASAGGFKHVLVSDAWATAANADPKIDQQAIKGKGLPFQLLQQVLTSEELGAFRFAAELGYLKRAHKLPKMGGNVLQQLQIWSAYFGGPKTGAASETTSVARIEVGDQESLDEAIEAGIKWIRFDFAGAQMHETALAAMEEAGDADGHSLAYCDWIAMPTDSKGQPNPVFLPEKPDFYYGLGRDFTSAGAIFRTRTIKDLLKGKVPETRTEVWALAQEILGGVAYSSVHVPNLMAAAPENMDTDGRIALIKQFAPEYSCEKIGDFGFIKVRKELELDDEGLAPKVSVVIPTSGNRWLLRPCLATLAKNTEYPGDVEVILVISGSEHDLDVARGQIARLDAGLFTHVVEVLGDFSFPKACNAGANHATGDYVLFLNDDVRFPTAGWLSGMVALAQEEKTAWVGTRLIKQDGTLQCAGVYAGEGAAFECFKGIQVNDIGFAGFAHLLRQTGAACAACALIEKHKFFTLDKFDEAFPWNYNDVMAGYYARQAGYVNLLYTGHDVMHLESASRGKAKHDESIRRLLVDGKLLKTLMTNPDDTFPQNLEAKTVWRGLAAQGSRFENLDWDESGITGKRVLAIGMNVAGIAKNVRDGNRVFVATVTNGKLKFQNPGIAALGEGIPVANEQAIKGVLTALDISEIHLVPNQGEETIMPDLASTWVPTVVNGS